MTIDAYNRVWEHTPDRRGTRKLALLALAKHADALGVCWPSVETIAKLIGEERDYTRKILREAEEHGDVVRRPGQGRGIPTVYGIAVGLDTDQRHKLAILVQHTIVKRGQRLIELDGHVVPYTPGAEEQLYNAEKGVLQPPFLDDEPVENSRAQKTAPAPTFSRPARRPAQEPEAIRWLREDEGITTAGNFAHADLDALILDYKNRRAEKQPKGAIVKYWNEYGTPTKENYYGRHNEEDQPGRPAQAAPQRRRRPVPGDPDYDYGRP